MFQPPPDPNPSPVQPSIFLDYGVDGSTAEDANCEICERGMRFKSGWQFVQGTVLSIAFSVEGEVNERPSRVEAEGIVVECAKLGPREHLTTLAFLDLPAGVRKSLGQVSMRLHPNRPLPKAEAEETSA